MKITICLGSSCHLKGSRKVVEQLQYLVNTKGLKDQIELAGSFCFGECHQVGVNVAIDDTHYSILPENVNAFFEEEVLPKLN